MTKFFFTGLLLLFFQVSGFSQRFYVKASGSYNWPAGARNISSDYQAHYMAATNSFTETFAYKRGSYGAGLTGGLAFGYRFTDQLWVEGGPSYLAGKTYRSQEHYSGNFAGRAASETYARMPAMAASLVIAASGRQWRPYAKAGIIAGKARVYNYETNTFNNDTVTREWEIKGKTAWGFQGGLGVHYALNARLGLFLEGIFRTLCFIPEKGRVTSYALNGEDQLNNLPVRQRDLEYKQSYTTSSGQGPDDQASQTNNEPFPFGAAGLQLGLQLHLR